jgi:hypothetical protein
MAADFLNCEAGPEQAPTSVFRLQKALHCAGALAAVEQPSVEVFVVEEVVDIDGSHGRLLSLAVMPSIYAATRTIKNFFLSGAPRGAPSSQTSSTKINMLSFL